MIIKGDTKISTILKENPAALDVIVSISPEFEKLRNPILRRIMAGKATVSMASRIAGCTEKNFADHLKPLGFEYEIPISDIRKDSDPNMMMPDWINSSIIRDLDVRPILNGGEDPFKIIMSEVKNLKENEALRILNTFEPLPLIAILNKQGFLTHTVFKENKLVETYFFKAHDNSVNEPLLEKTSRDDDWHDLLKRFEGKIKIIDVRNMEMPMPMMTILSELDIIDPDGLLFVHHKRVPIFLLPELREKNYEYRIREVDDNETQLLIFRTL